MEIAEIDAELLCWSVLSLERVTILKERKAWLIQNNPDLKVRNGYLTLIQTYPGKNHPILNLWTFFILFISSNISYKILTDFYRDLIMLLLVLLVRVDVEQFLTLWILMLN